MRVPNALRLRYNWLRSNTQAYILGLRFHSITSVNILDVMTRRYEPEPSLLYRRCIKEQQHHLPFLLQREGMLCDDIHTGTENFLPRTRSNKVYDTHGEKIRHKLPFSPFLVHSIHRGVYPFSLKKVSDVASSFTFKTLCGGNAQKPTTAF